MRHFLSISHLSTKDIEQLLTRAFFFKQQITTNVFQINRPSYSQYELANLFYENSTRTRISFELAAKRLSIPVIQFHSLTSSEMKGETILDTLKNLTAMGIRLFIIRHPDNYFPQYLAESLNEACGRSCLINAGDGTNEHPTQAMLDLMTIIEKKPCLHQLKITLIGDLAHSRVVNSLQHLLKLMGIGELVFVSPAEWKPNKVDYGYVTHSLREGIDGADVVICFRVQRERLQEHETIDLASYYQSYGLTSTALRWAKPNAIVMHPGPINYGIEIDMEVVHGAQSVIMEQVTNGVYMRMAILEALIHSNCI